MGSRGRLSRGSVSIKSPKQISLSLGVNFSPKGRGWGLKGHQGRFLGQDG